VSHPFGITEEDNKHALELMFSRYPRLQEAIQTADLALFYATLEEPRETVCSHGETPSGKPEPLVMPTLTDNERFDYVLNMEALAIDIKKRVDYATGAKQQIHALTQKLQRSDYALTSMQEEYSRLDRKLMDDKIKKDGPKKAAKKSKKPTAFQAATLLKSLSPEELAKLIAGL
jgi:hypothetical protein